MANLDLPNKKFKIAVLGKLNEIQNKDNSTKSGKQSMNKMSLTKRQKSFKRTKQTFWNCLKKAMNKANKQTKNAIKRIDMRMHQAKEKIFKLEDRYLAIIQSGKQRIVKRNNETYVIYGMPQKHSQ